MVAMSAVGAAGRRKVIDPRLVIGIVLVVASVGAVVLLVGNAERTTAVYTAGRSLVPGDVVTADDLVVTQVRLAESAARYLSTEQLPAAGLVLTRYIDQGELLPVSALGRTDGQDVTTIVIPLAASLPEQVGVGSVVDLWSAQALDRGAYGAPVVLADDALVTGIRESDSMIAGAQNQVVEVQIPRALTARVLEAVANQASLALIPTSQPAER
jgi:hypothetical protein